MVKNVDKFDVKSISKKSPIGSTIYKLHNEYPLAPGKLVIPYDMLSDYCIKIADKYEIKLGEVKELIPNLDDKTNYVVYYRNLQLYLSLGMILTKICRVLKFKQSDWMKSYIDFNTEKSTKATKKFEKDFFKLVINTVYGKKNMQI